MLKLSFREGSYDMYFRDGWLLLKDYTDTKRKNSVAPNLELTKWMWKSYRRFKLTVNKQLNILVKGLDINDANDVIKTGDVTKNVARRSLAP